MADEVHTAQLGWNEMRYMQPLEEDLEPIGQKSSMENSLIISLDVPAGPGLFRNKIFSLPWAAIDII